MTKRVAQINSFIRKWREEGIVLENIKEIEERCYNEFAKFIFKRYYKQMLEQKRREINEKKKTEVRASP